MNPVYTHPKGDKRPARGERTADVFIDETHSGCETTGPSTVVDAGECADPGFVAYFTYDAVHTTLLPAALLAGAWYAGWPLGVHFALIWLAHLGADRTVGYGLKYPGAEFSETHLQRV